MSTQVSKIDLEEISDKLKGIDFLVNGMMYLNNFDEDTYTSGVMVLSDNIRNIINDIKNIEEIV